MPRLRENIKGVLEDKSEKISDEKEIIIQEKYSKRSPIRKAYEAGVMPVDHKRLYEAIKHELGELKEGKIQLEKVLQSTGYLRASALKMLKHMQNFGVLETKPRYRATWVKILKD